MDRYDRQIISRRIQTVDSGNRKPFWHKLFAILATIRSGLRPESWWLGFASISCARAELWRHILRPNRGAVVIDDAQLIDSALAGNSTAFGQLVCKYQDRLYNTIAHVIGSPDEAYDVVQDAFVQAFIKLETFRGHCAFYTWLYRIAFNTAISRRRRRRPVLSVDRVREESGLEPLCHQPSAEDRLDQQERAGQVQAALATLSEEHRAVLVLREMEGCCYETISEMLELPVGTVRSRLHRARLQLREQLKGVLQTET